MRVPRDGVAGVMGVASHRAREDAGDCEWGVRGRGHKQTDGFY